MKILISCYIFLVTLSVCLAKSTSIASIFLSPASAICKSTGLECSNCETLQYCSTGSEPLFAIKCADQSKLRPFCDSSTNTCVAKEPSNCVKEANKFHCPGEGLYPDLEHCRKYYQCGADGSQEHLSCGLTKIYTHSIQGCAKGLCRTYNAKTGLCRGKINKLIAYANDKNLYVLCLADAPKLFQCPKNEVFDENSVGCKFQCTQNGFFPSRDVEKYYFCYKVGKTYQEMILHCPDNSEFIAGEPGQGVCMPKEDPTTPEVTPEPTTSNPTTSDATSSDATTSNPTTPDATSSDATTSNPTTSDAISSDPTTSDATSSDATSSDPTTSEATSSDATTSDPITSDATSSDATTSDPITSDATSSDATSSDTTTPDPTTSDATTSDATSSDATSSDATSSDTTTLDPTTSDATTSDPTSSDPTSSDPTSSDATSSDATSADPLSNY